MDPKCKECIKFLNGKCTNGTIIHKDGLTIACSYFEPTNKVVQEKVGR